jgi:hypothetical protein
MPKGIRKVDTIKHEKLGVEVPLRLDFGSMEFQAQYAGRTFTDKDGGVVTQQVLDHIEKENAITWTPVIEVEDTSHRMERAGDRSGSTRHVAVAFRIRRFHLGKATSGRILQAQWDIPKQNLYNAAEDIYIRPQHADDRGKAEMPIFAKDLSLPWRELPDRWRQRPTRTFLDYTEELWAGLNGIADIIEKERQQLATLVGNVEAFTLVAELGAGAMSKLLPATVDDEEDE